MDIDENISASEMAHALIDLEDESTTQAIRAFNRVLAELADARGETFSINEAYDLLDCDDDTAFRNALKAIVGMAALEGIEPTDDDGLAKLLMLVWTFGSLFGQRLQREQDSDG